MRSRIGRARPAGVELDAVDDVAAIARQLDAACVLGRRRARLGELAGHAAELHDRQRRRKVSTTAICSRTRKVSRMLLALNSAKLSAQSPPWSRKAVPSATLAELRLSAPRLAGEDQRRIAGELGLGVGERDRVGIVGHLACVGGAPAGRGPVGVLLCHCARLLRPRTAVDNSTIMVASCQEPRLKRSAATDHAGGAVVSARAPLVVFECLGGLPWAWRAGGGGLRQAKLAAADGLPLPSHCATCG